MEILRRHAEPVSLQQLVNALKNSTLPKRAVVVTFDDGYADNLYNAKPTLERYDVPATVFVAAGYVDREIEFWWDELERLLLQPGELPSTLSLDINGNRQEWQLGAAAFYSQSTYNSQRYWNILSNDDPTARHQMYRLMHQWLRPLTVAVRLKVLDQLRVLAGVPATGRPAYRALKSSEVVELAAGELLEVGAHTMTHPVLSALPLAEQRAEVRQSKDRLEEILGLPVKSFSYPYGTPNDYTRETVGIMRESGFESACANFTGTVRNKNDIFELPRLLVRDWDGDQFNQQLGAVLFS